MDFQSAVFLRSSAVLTDWLVEKFSESIVYIMNISSLDI